MPLERLHLAYTRARTFCFRDDPSRCVLESEHSPVAEVRLYRRRVREARLT